MAVGHQSLGTLEIMVLKDQWGACSLLLSLDPLACYHIVVDLDILGQTYLAGHSRRKVWSMDLCIGWGIRSHSCGKDI